MDFYHSWLYIYVLNAKWFVWSTVIAILAFNTLAPIIIWIIMNGKTSLFKKKVTKEDTK